MHNFFEIAIEPVLRSIDARTVVEIGCADGSHTSRLLEYCQEHGSRLHCVDPEPNFESSLLAAEAPHSFIFHRTTSLDVLPSLRETDIVLIDGDHNWYTVYHELQSIEGNLRSHHGSLPVIALHDVGWPYGRRDAYYDPDRIPEGKRQNMARGGVLPGNSELCEEGLNRAFLHATHEGGPRNGVRTAIEDFLAESRTRWRQVVLEAHFGLAILAPEEMLEAFPGLRTTLDGLEGPEGLKQLISLQNRIEITLHRMRQNGKGIDSVEVNQTETKICKTKRPSVSVVVVVYNMGREAPRTLHSLSAEYQQGIDSDDYEIIVVENGSNQPLDPDTIREMPGRFQYHYIEHAGPSPAAAINLGIESARGRCVGVFVDGARLASPGLLANAKTAAGLHPRAVVGSVGWLLGHENQGLAVAAGRYSQEVEDQLLDRVNWPEDGYRLFEIAVIQGSNPCGWFTPMAESNALFMSPALWEELGGADERFAETGGGFLNLDLYERAASLPDSELILMVGEGVFHQVHDGIATNAAPWDLADRLSRWHTTYKRIRGRAFRPPKRRPLIFGRPHPSLYPHMRAALEAASLASPFDLDGAIAAMKNQAQDLGE